MLHMAKRGRRGEGRRHEQQKYFRGAILVGFLSPFLVCQLQRGETAMFAIECLSTAGSRGARHSKVHLEDEKPAGRPFVVIAHGGCFELALGSTWYCIVKVQPAGTWFYFVLLAVVPP